MSDACPYCGTHAEASAAERVPAEFGAAHTEHERIRELDREVRHLQQTIARLRATRR